MRNATLALLLLAAPAPAARVLAPTGFPGWQSRQVCDPVVVRHAGGYRMYYSAAATDQRSHSTRDVWVTGVVLSSDTRSWRYPDAYEPVLFGRPWRIGEVVEQARRTAFDTIEARVGSVLPDASGWRMFYTGWNGEERALGGGRSEKVGHRIGMASSRDGLRWTRQGAVLPPGDANAGDTVSASAPWVLRDGARWRMWYEVYDGRRWRIAHATSGDGRTWTPGGAVLEPGGEGALDADGTRHAVVVATPRGFEMYYQGRTGSASRVLRAKSDDGLTWRKLDGEAPLVFDPPMAAGEEVHPGTVIIRPGGRRQVFFARETTTAREGAWGAVPTRTFAIYTQTIGAPE